VYILNIQFWQNQTHPTHLQQGQTNAKKNPKAKITTQVPGDLAQESKSYTAAADMVGHSSKQLDWVCHWVHLRDCFCQVLRWPFPPSASIGLLALNQIPPAWAPHHWTSERTPQKMQNHDQRRSCVRSTSGYGQLGSSDLWSFSRVLDKW